MSGIKHKTRSEKLIYVYTSRPKRDGKYHKNVTCPVNEKAKEYFNIPVYPGLFSKRSEENDKSSSNR